MIFFSFLVLDCKTMVCAGVCLMIGGGGLYTHEGEVQSDDCKSVGSKSSTYVSI